MHGSVMDFLRREIKASEIAGKEVLEIGSQNVNGSPREVILPLKPLRYFGVDFSQAEGVDHVLDVGSAEFRTFFFPQSYDVVISTEMLEHALDWKSVVQNMKYVLWPEGLLVVTTRGPGFPYHGYPHDYWRFTIDDFRAIFADMQLLFLKPDPEAPGVLMKARSRPEFPAADLSRISVRSVS